MINSKGTDGKLKNDYGLPVFRMGFRPFFLLAGIYAIISMAVWLTNTVFATDISTLYLSPVTWHAHEMIFGYTMAVVAGFLLTAIQNWTGISVLRGKELAFLVSLWLLARLLHLYGNPIPLEIIAVVDVAFLLLLVVFCLRPILKTKQYVQMGIISKLIMLMLCNIVFYLGVTGVILDGIQWGLYSAVYIIIALLLVMLRRVMPMFIQNGINDEVKMTNRLWLDNASIVLLLCLWIADVFTDFDQLTALFAVFLVLLHALRLAGWYTHKVWRKPLLWVLVLSYVFIILGFALKASEVYFAIPVFLSLHAFTVGGIGLLTLGMMSRVSLGHTGRDVFVPPKIVFWSFFILTLAAIVRVLFPLISMDIYGYWLGLSQALWLIAFTIFIFVYAPMFVSARIDGKDG